MRAIPIKPHGGIAVEAQDSKSCGEFSRYQVFVNALRSAIGLEFASMCCAVIFDVIKRQKLVFPFSATCTLIAVCIKNRLLQRAALSLHFFADRRGIFAPIFSTAGAMAVAVGGFPLAAFFPLLFKSLFAPSLHAIKVSLPVRFVMNFGSLKRQFSVFQIPGALSFSGFFLCSFHTVIIQSLSNIHKDKTCRT